MDEDTIKAEMGIAIAGILSNGFGGRGRGRGNIIQWLTWAGRLLEVLGMRCY